MKIYHHLMLNDLGEWRKINSMNRVVKTVQEKINFMPNVLLVDITNNDRIMAERN